MRAMCLDWFFFVCGLHLALNVDKCWINFACFVKMCNHGKSSFFYNSFYLCYKFPIYKTIKSDFVPTVHSVSFAISNISKIWLSSVAWYDFISKCCDCCCWLFRFQFTEHMTLIVIWWCWTTCHEREDGPICAKNKMVKNWMSRIRFFAQ